MLTGQEIETMYRRACELADFLDGGTLLSGFDAVDERNVEDIERRTRQIRSATTYDILEGQFAVSRRETLVGEIMDDLSLNVEQYYQALDEAVSALYRIENALLSVGFITGVYDPDAAEDNALRNLMDE